MNGKEWFGVCYLGPDRKSKELEKLIEDSNVGWPVIHLRRTDIRRMGYKPPYVVCNGSIFGYDASKSFIASLSR